VDSKVPRNILFLPDGTVAQVAEKIAPKGLPAPVTDAVKRQYPNATIRSAMKVTHADVVEYGLALSGGNQKRVVISGDGTVASTEGKKALERNQ